ncbi:MazG nucleotide pyrophosphohydrolase domain-containing protein [Brevibacterium moorei]|uniref:MazG nucleotide pyrophosphohydrolase domain-containing protein n=1 Tax=Brevibacterium moorei TaxID=2968457 RepID=UPI00211CA852|nr:MazG nucleotide pyrophosphohydrolase domain-containing protein [Brevibacterium sp. 68QC2CO]MCQ9385093.1 hypothetical protein [Brevibacterium sp. 68QC2CO]
MTMVKGYVEAARKFALASGQACETTPVMPTPADGGLAMELVEEEYDEVLAAIEKIDSYAYEERKGMTFYEGCPAPHIPVAPHLHAELADGIADLIFVLIRAAQTFGIDIEAVCDTVASSNLSKINPDTGEVPKRDDGKVLKGPQWIDDKPLILSIIQEGIRHGSN